MTNFPRPSLLPAFVALAMFASLACGDGDSKDSAATPAAPTARATAAPTAKPANDVAAKIASTKYPLDTAKGTQLGNPDAKVMLEVYEDFQCPFCLKFTAALEPGIIEDFVAKGKVLFVFHNLPILGGESVNAALAAQCAADQNQFWPYHKKLFLSQAEAGQADSEKLNVGRFAEANLKAFADELKLDRAAFDACLTGAGASEKVTADLRAAQSLGVRGTPSFVINGQLLTSGSPADNAGWKKLLEDKLAGR